MADIFKEVDEDLRRDNLEKLWKKYSFQIIGMVVAVVLAVAGVQGWQAYDLDQRGKLSDRYGAALDLAQDGDTAAGLDALIDMSEASDSGYAGLAAFEEARLRVESGDTAGAIALWAGQCDSVAFHDQGLRFDRFEVGLRHRIGGSDC